MSISVSGLGSGLEYDTWITQLVAARQKKIDAVSAKVNTINKKESTLSTIENDYKAFQSAVKSFTSALSNEDVFNQKTATSSSTAVAASVTTGANAQNLSVSVSKLATSTSATSASVAASFVNGSTKMSAVSSGAFKAGTLSVYVGGAKSSIAITADETLGDVVTALNKVSGVTASIGSDGKLSISGSNVTVGSSSDTSNFKNVMALTGTTGSYSSSKSLFNTDSSKSLVSGNYASPITAGSFMIGNAKFTIDSSTTMDGLVSQINKSTTAGVKAAWDSTTGKMSLTATNEGATNINITAGDGTANYSGASNFTDVMGFTTSTFNPDSTLATTALKNNSQTLGGNAVLKINGTEITSSSNTVTSDISGIAGLTLTLNAITTSDSTVAVAQDTSKIITAITKVVSAYNTAISATDASMTTTGDLYGETILKSLRNTMRGLVSAKVDGVDGYTTLASIGITTGAFSTNTKADITQLKIDTDALTKALSKDSSAVRTLLVGNADSKGVFDKFETVLANATDTTKGYFVKRDASYKSQATRLNKQVGTMNTDLAKYKKDLEIKFSAMDKLISSLKSSASIFDSYFNNSSNKSK